MADIAVRIDYQDLPFISDRTARDILKGLSKAIRRAQASEIEDFLVSTDLSVRERQSITDRIRHRLAEGPVFYLENLRAGSLEATVLLTGFSLWLLSATLGETIKDAWKESKIHTAIIDYVKSMRSNRFSELLERALRDKDVLKNRTTLHSITIDSQNENVIIVILKSYRGIEIEHSEQIKTDDIIQQCNDRIELLSKIKDDSDGDSL